MDPLIYSAMAGAERALRAQQVHANNLANLSTTGFRADLELATSETVPGYGFDARHMSKLQANAVSARPGTMVATGRDLDAAIAGEGFFAVQFGDGEAYTRSGAFTQDAEGTLLLDGRKVMGETGPIVLAPTSKIAIGEDGTISAQVEGQQLMQAVDKLKLVKPAAADLAKNEAGLVISRSGAPLPGSETVLVRGGYLEGSNVSAVEEMVSTMGLNRDFEIQMKLFKAADDMAANGNRLMRE